MKKHALLILMMVAALAATLGEGTVFAQGKAKPEGPSKEGPGYTIKQAVVGTGVENREPKGVAETFPAATEKVTCFLEAADIAKDTEVSFVWYYGDKELLKYQAPLKAGPKWRTWSAKNLRGSKGDWKVGIKDGNGNLLKEVKFKVE